MWAWMSNPTPGISSWISILSDSDRIEINLKFTRRRRRAPKDAVKRELERSWPGCFQFLFTRTALGGRNGGREPRTRNTLARMFPVEVHA